MRRHVMYTCQDHRLQSVDATFSNEYPTKAGATFLFRRWTIVGKISNRSISDSPSIFVSFSSPREFPPVFTGLLFFFSPPFFLFSQSQINKVYSLSHFERSYFPDPLPSRVLLLSAVSSFHYATRVCVLLNVEST